jgi:dTDP-glucose 4,6-dehydratase
MPGSRALPLPAADLDHVLRHTPDVWEKLRGVHLFVTGGTGFFGRWMLESLLHADREFDLGARVTLLTRDARRAAALASVLVADPAVKLLEGDVNALESITGDFTDILHMAAETSYPPGGVSSGDAFRSGALGALGVLGLARRCGVRRLLLTSSGAVYGGQPADCARLTEDARLAPPTDDPLSGYGQGKRAAEFLCASAADEWGLQATIARCFAFVGPLLPLDANYAIGNFIADALWNPVIDVRSDGAARRSYLYAADLAVWLWTILVHGAPGRPYNVGSPDDLSIGELAHEVGATLAPDKAVRIALEPRPGVPPPRYVPDTTRAQDELGLRVSVALREGIERTAMWHGWTPPTAAGPAAGD